MKFFRKSWTSWKFWTSLTSWKFWTSWTTWTFWKSWKSWNRQTSSRIWPSPWLSRWRLVKTVPKKLDLIKKVTVPVELSVQLQLKSWAHHQKRSSLVDYNQLSSTIKGILATSKVIGQFLLHNCMICCHNEYWPSCYNWMVSVCYGFVIRFRVW